MKIKCIGVDLAKHVFQVHGVDEAERVVVGKRLTRGQMLKFFAQVEPTLVGMEACGGAHYWAPELSKLGHTAKLILPQYVKPYVKMNKNDANDAAGVCEALSRPQMRFVPVKGRITRKLHVRMLSLHPFVEGIVQKQVGQERANDPSLWRSSFPMLLRPVRQDHVGL